MALIKPPAPEEVRAAFRSGLDRSDNATAPPSVRNARFAMAGGAAPDQEQPVFTLGLQDLASGNGLAAAQPAGWRIVKRDAAGGAAAGQITQPAAGGAPVMLGLAHGSELGEIVAGEIQVENLPEARSVDYELRALELPGIPLQAFWLKPVSAGQDLIVPVRTLSPELQAMRAYPADEFLRIVQPIAAKRLAFDDKPQR